MGGGKSNGGPSAGSTCQRRRQGFEASVDHETFLGFADNLSKRRIPPRYRRLLYVRSTSSCLPLASMSVPPSAGHPVRRIAPIALQRSLGDDSSGTACGDPSCSVASRGVSSVDGDIVLDVQRHAQAGREWQGVFLWWVVVAEFAAGTATAVQLDHRSLREDH